MQERIDEARDDDKYDAAEVEKRWKAHPVAWRAKHRGWRRRHSAQYRAQHPRRRRSHSRRRPRSLGAHIARFRRCVKACTDDACKKACQRKLGVFFVRVERHLRLRDASCTNAKCRSVVQLAVRKLHALLRRALLTNGDMTPAADTTPATSAPATSSQSVVATPARRSLRRAVRRVLARARRHLKRFRRNVAACADSTCRKPHSRTLRRRFRAARNRLRVLRARATSRRDRRRIRFARRQLKRWWRSTRRARAPSAAAPAHTDDAPLRLELAAEDEPTHAPRKWRRRHHTSRAQLVKYGFNPNLSAPELASAMYERLSAHLRACGDSARCRARVLSEFRRVLRAREAALIRMMRWRARAQLASRVRDCNKDTSCINIAKAQYVSRMQTLLEREMQARKRVAQRACDSAPAVTECLKQAEAAFAKDLAIAQAELASSADAVVAQLVASGGDNVTDPLAKLMTVNDAANTTPMVSADGLLV